MIQKTSNKIQFKFKKATKNKKLTKFKKTRKRIKKNDITITFMKSNTFIKSILNVKSILNINQLLLNLLSLINSVDKKIKFVSFMFDTIFNEFDEFFFKIKNDINNFQRQLNQFVQKNFKFKHKICQVGLSITGTGKA